MAALKQRLHAADVSDVSSVVSLVSLRGEAFARRTGCGHSSAGRPVEMRAVG
jgi:hypothetical protein